MRLMIFFAILASCTPNSSYKKTNNIVDDKNISFNEFKINIINYAKKSKYPNIND